MGVFRSDDFEGRPYEAGLNQLGHCCFGGALFLIAQELTSQFWALLIVGLGTVFWEAYQRRYQQASLVDYVMDLCYWISGVFGLAVLMHNALGSYFAVLPIVCFVVEYDRIAKRSKMPRLLLAMVER